MLFDYRDDRIAELEAELVKSILREAATRQASLHAGDLYEQMKQRAEAAELLAGQLRAALAQAKGTLRDFTANWDCDEDAHRYRTPCRCCVAEKASNEADAALAAPVPALHAELEAGRKDTARLNRLLSALEIDIEIDGMCGLNYHDLDRAERGEAAEHLRAWREAIDAAPEPTE